MYFGTAALNSDNFQRANFISEGMPSYVISRDMINFCVGLNRFIVKIDFLRDSCAYPLFWQNTSIQWFERGV